MIIALRVLFILVIASSILFPTKYTNEHAALGLQIVSTLCILEIASMLRRRFKS